MTIILQENEINKLQMIKFECIRYYRKKNVK